MLDGRHPRRFKRRVVALVFWLSVLVAVWAAAQSATTVEYAYARRAGAHLGRAISVATGVVPFSVAEVALAGVAVYLLLPLVTTVVQIFGGRRRVVEAASSGLLRVLVFAAFVTAAFYLTWGLNYARAPLRERLGWQAIEPLERQARLHQRGFAAEDEANFVGYLACASSASPYVRYSGSLFALRQLTREVVLRAGTDGVAKLGPRLPGVQRDVATDAAFWRRYAGRASQISSRVNDRHLRTQGDRRGIASYSASRSLIVLFARHNGGRAIVP